MADLASVFDQLNVLGRNATSFEGLSKLGYHYDVTSQYTSDGILDDALEYYRRSVAAREKAIGLNLALTLRAKHMLINVLIKKGKH